MKKFLCFFFLIAACESTMATPENATIFKKSLDPVGGRVQIHDAKLSLPGEEGETADILLKIRAVENEKSKGLTITALEGVMGENAGGWEVTLSGVGNPINLGTIEKPIMSVPVIVSRYRNNGCSKQTRQNSFTVRADGEVSEN